jgi:hypothetical protein
MTFSIVSDATYRSYYEYALNSAQQHQQLERQRLREITLNTDENLQHRIPITPPNSQPPPTPSTHPNLPGACQGSSHGHAPPSASLPVHSNTSPLLQGSFSGNVDETRNGFVLTEVRIIEYLHRAQCRSDNLIALWIQSKPFSRTVLATGPRTREGDFYPRGVFEPCTWNSAPR